MWKHAKVMTEATPRHSSCQLFLESSTSFKDLSDSNQALAQKIMYMTVQIIMAYSCFLVKRRQGCHLTGICQWSQVSMLWVQEKIILHKNVPNWDIWNQSKRYFFAGSLPPAHLFDVSFVLHDFWGDSEVSFKLVLISFMKIRQPFTSYCQLIGGQKQSDWTEINLIQVQHYMDITPGRTAYWP